MKHNATIMPAVAATITARGRIALHQHARRAPDLAYCDTDSIVTGGRLAMPESKAIGDWKIEAHLWEADFEAPKAYRIVAHMDSGEPCKPKLVQGPDGIERLLVPPPSAVGPAQSRTLHAKGMPRRDLQLLASYLAGKPVDVGRVPGIRESMRRGVAIDGQAELQTRQHRAGGNRHPEGRAFRIDELTALP